MDGSLLIALKADGDSSRSRCGKAEPLPLYTPVSLQLITGLQRQGSK